jgi:cell division protein FtsQ
MLRKIIKILLFWTAFAVFLGGTFFSLNQRGYFNLTDIPFEFADPSALEHGNYYAIRVVEAQKMLEPFRGVPLWKLNLQEISNHLQKLAWIEDFQITRRWPEQLLVSVKPKQIRFILPAKIGFHPVVGEGDVLPAIEGKSIPDVPLLQLKKNQSDKKLIRRTVELVKEIPASGRFSNKTIAEIHYEEKDGFWIRMMKENIRVRMGENQFAVKSARVSQVLDYIDSRQLQTRVIDADLSKKVLVKLRKAP